MAFKNRLFIFLLGAAAGMCLPFLFRYCSHDVAEKEAEPADTTIRYETKSHSRLELAQKTYDIDVPSIKGIGRFVLYPVDDTDTVVVEKKVYVSMERQHRYTETDDAQIWHSGIDSTIDSLNVFSKTTSVTKSIQPVTKCNALSIGIEPSYLNSLSIPIYLEYGRMLHKNVEIYGQFVYDVQSRQFGMGIGLEASIGW